MTKSPTKLATSTDPLILLTTDFSETARQLFSAGGVHDTLAQIVQVAVDTIEGCDCAGVFEIVGGVVTASAHTDPVVIEIDALQHSAGEGPCLDSVFREAAVYSSDLANDPRWPLFGPAAAAKGMRSLLALPLLDDSTPGALNLYAWYPDAFGVVDRARGLLLAAVAGLAFSTARSHEDDARREVNLHMALTSREAIGQAQGILMERERITADQAFDVLRRASQHLNIKLREVAQILIETGERPDTGASRASEATPATSHAPSPEPR